MIKYAAAMGANFTALTDRLYLHKDDQGPVTEGNIEIETFSIDTHDWGDEHIDPPGIVIFLQGKPDPEGVIEEVTLAMGRDEARKLAEAILANGVVSPERN